MRKCKHFEKQLVAYIHGELSEQQVLRLEDHLDSCASCLAELESQRDTLDLLGEALDAAPVPEEIAVRGWSRSRSAPREGFWYSPRFAGLMVATASAAVFFIIVQSIVFYSIIERKERSFEVSGPVADESPMQLKFQKKLNAKQYNEMAVSGLNDAMQSPLSSFSIDVGQASYAHVRNCLDNNLLPSEDAVQIEEMINYFDYSYPKPQGNDPFAVAMEISECPWDEEHQLALIGLQGVEISAGDLPPNNLVFLLDISKSMNSPDKLPLLTSAMSLMAGQLRPEDRVSIVVYSDAEGLVLEPTSDRNAIVDALGKLSAGGSTADGKGIQLAYKTAKENFIADGNNRVILATDGDYKVGGISSSKLLELIEENGDAGVALSVVGFGSENYRDAKMELLARTGNGNHAYIDDILEAKKVLVSEMGGTLSTIARNVKVQVEFNPAQVKAYRLLGYENRMPASAGFDDGEASADELGAGHTVTALYELIPSDSAESVREGNELKYQITQLVNSDELLTVKLNYRSPGSSESTLITRSVSKRDVQNIETSDDLGFASAVAEFGMLLRDSEFKGCASYDHVLHRARKFKGADERGCRAEFIQLVEKARLLEQVRD